MRAVHSCILNNCQFLALYFLNALCVSTFLSLSWLLCPLSSGGQCVSGSMCLNKSGVCGRSVYLRPGLTLFCSSLVSSERTNMAAPRRAERSSREVLLLHWYWQDNVWSQQNGNICTFCAFSDQTCLNVWGHLKGIAILRSCSNRK